MSEAEDEATVAALAPVRREESTNLVRPAASPGDIAEAFKQYQDVRTSILEGSDFQGAGDSAFLKRSGWRKLSTAFGVTFTLVERNIERDETGRIARAEFVTRAQAPNGRAVDGWGACDVYERCCDPGCDRNHRHCDGMNGWHGHYDAWTHFSKAEHDIPSTAETRSKNRAAADLFGMGEVSAEEANTSTPNTPSQPQQQPQGQPQAGEGGITDAQQRKLRATCAEDPSLPDDALGWAVWNKFGVASTTELTKKQASELIDKLSDAQVRQKTLEAWSAQRQAEESEQQPADGAAADDGQQAEDDEVAEAEVVSNGDDADEDMPF